MKIRESAEDYLETILVLKNRNGLVRSIDIATELGYSKPSVSIAMKNLRENGYIVVDSKGFIELAEPGRQIAEKIYERHTFLSSWFMELGIDPKTAVEDLKLSKSMSSMSKAKNKFFHNSCNRK